MITKEELDDINRKIMGIVTSIRGNTTMDGNELFKILEHHYTDNYALAEEMTKDIAEKTNEPLEIVEKAIYRTSTTTGNSALAIAAIVAEYLLMVKDIHTDARNAQEEVSEVA